MTRSELVFFWGETKWRCVFYRLLCCFRCLFVSSLSLCLCLWSYFQRRERKSEGHDTYFRRLVYSRSQKDEKQRWKRLTQGLTEIYTVREKEKVTEVLQYCCSWQKVRVFSDICWVKRRWQWENGDENVFTLFQVKGVGLSNIRHVVWVRVCCDGGCPSILFHLYSLSVLNLLVYGERRENLKTGRDLWSVGCCYGSSKREKTGFSFPSVSHQWKGFLNGTRWRRKLPVRQTLVNRDRQMQDTRSSLLSLTGTESILQESPAKEMEKERQRTAHNSMCEVVASRCVCNSVHVHHMCLSQERLERVISKKDKARKNIELQTLR